MQPLRNHLDGGFVMARRVLKSFRPVALGLLAAGVLLAPIAPQAVATVWNQRSILTFSQPFEIPGGQVLLPGTYIFQLAKDNHYKKDIVQIYDKDQTHLLATAVTIPAYRLNATRDTVITFEERAANAPEAVHDWYYPGMLAGHQFVYNR